MDWDSVRSKHPSNSTHGRNNTWGSGAHLILPGNESTGNPVDHSGNETAQTYQGSLPNQTDFSFDKGQELVTSTNDYINLQSCTNWQFETTHGGNGFALQTVINSGNIGHNNTIFQFQRRNNIIVRFMTGSISGTQRIWLEYKTDNGSGGGDVIDENDFDDDQFLEEDTDYRVSALYSGTHMYLVINGELIATKLATFLGTASNANNIFAWTNSTGGNDRRFVDGKMADVRIRDFISVSAAQTEDKSILDYDNFWGTPKNLDPSPGFVELRIQEDQLPGTHTDGALPVDLSNLGIDDITEANSIRVYSNSI